MMLIPCRALALIVAMVPVLHGAPNSCNMTCGPALLQQKTQMSPSTMDVSGLFEAIGDEGSACRGESASDNSPEYYVLHADVTPQDCMSLCVEEPRCQGIEHNARGRCEVWIRPFGIGTVAPALGYSCLRYTAASTTTAPTQDFEAVDGGEGRACRGLSPSDNQASYYNLLLGVVSLESCMWICMREVECKGIEYNRNGRCEIWTRPDGIGASASAGGYQCFRHAPATATTTTTTASVSTTEQPATTTEQPATTTVSEAPKVCSAAQVQRRRRQQEMCSCRRRSGTADLASGWACDGNVIVSTSEASTTPSPAPVPDGCVELLVIGDYGTRDWNQRRVASGLAAVAAERQPAAIAGIGDNIYGSGAEGNPQLLVDWWFNVYLPHPSLNRPWYVVTGNHDWYTDARTERDFTTHPDNRGGYWRMPAFWYKQSFRGESGVTVDAFFIDTQIWKGSSVAEGVLGTAAKQEQVVWLTSELAQSTADWKIMLGHHPVYSAGSHGITGDLLEELDPLMRQYGVQILFSGHDHSKQLMQHRGLNYVISGAGGASARSRSDEYPVGSQKHIFDDHGFAGLSICDASAANLTFYAADGQAQATVTLTSTPPDAAPEPGRPALANGNGAVLAPVCGGKVMRDVDLVCPSEDGSGCKVLADQMTQKTCREYCARNGLGCKDGWEEQNEDCVPTHDLGCDQAYGSTSDLICECMPE